MRTKWCDHCSVPSLVIAVFILFSWERLKACHVDTSLQGSGEKRTLQLCAFLKLLSTFQHLIIALKDVHLADLAVMKVSCAVVRHAANL
jgi:hypothetical protein